MGSGSREDICG